MINAAAKVNRATTTKGVETGFLGGIIAASFLPTAASGACVNVFGNQDDVVNQPDCIKPISEIHLSNDAGTPTGCQTSVPIYC